MHTFLARTFVIYSISPYNNNVIGEITDENIIKELYYGNIDPQARGFKNGSYLKKQITILSESEALLTEKLTGDEKKAFLSFINTSNSILAQSELDSFMVGFRLGTRLILDTFVNNDTPYEDFLKEDSELEIQNTTCI